MAFLFIEMSEVFYLFYLFSVMILCDPNCGVDIDDDGMHRLSQVIIGSFEWMILGGWLIFG